MIMVYRDPPEYYPLAFVQLRLQDPANESPCQEAPRFWLFIYAL